MDSERRWKAPRLFDQDGGTDWRTVKVMNVATGKILPTS
jgi:hypothetical protein